MTTTFREHWQIRLLREDWTYSLPPRLTWSFGLYWGWTNRQTVNGHQVHRSLTARSRTTPPQASIQSPHMPSRTHQRIGPRLLREHGLQCAKGYFSKTGIPFQKPDRFPAAFFDNQGYIIVDDEASMRSNPYINVGKQVSIPKGVHSIPSYVKCEHNHS